MGNKVERSVLPLAYAALGFYVLDWFLLLASWVHLTNIFYSTASCIVESVARNGVVRAHATFHDMISEKGSYSYGITVGCCLHHPAPHRCWCDAQRQERWRGSHKTRGWPRGGIGAYNLFCFFFWVAEETCTLERINVVRFVSEVSL